MLQLEVAVDHRSPPSVKGDLVPDRISTIRHRPVQLAFRSKSRALHVVELTFRRISQSRRCMRASCHLHACTAAKLWITVASWATVISLAGHAG